ncbi:hypothetical protein BH24GEM3_BH24GEM3_19770 [soil metagenome]
MGEDRVLDSGESMVPEAGTGQKGTTVGASKKDRPGSASRGQRGRRSLRDSRPSLIQASYLSARRGFPSDAALAEAFPVSPSRVARWKQGEIPDRENARFLRDVGIVVSLLDEYLDDDVIPDWLHGVNAHLGDRRPLEAIREGRLSEVVRAIEAEKSGAFA